jgi:putative transcriptional regulator
MVNISEYRLRNNLRKVRRGKADITQLELADFVGCTRQTIVALEGERYSPSLFLALSIAKVLDVPIDEIFELIKNEVQELK